MKHISEIHENNQPLSVRNLFQGEQGKAISIQIKRQQSLKEHITQTPALLICISGAIIFSDENDTEFELNSGDFVNIAVNIKHWLFALADSHLLLLK